MPILSQPFRCMACGHEYEEPVDEERERERQCPRCRSNSVRRLKRVVPTQPKPEELPT
ncbi:MAG: hypothetical protein JXB39_16555 [Deltaproteobacteria bacterium]|nr:hypothetical protein [Deltaproteobacteria bacterium]